MKTTRERTVLVTGASGFIAMHCILQLLEQGYTVRGTLRTPSRELNLRKTLASYTDVGERLSFVTADLTKDEGWAEAVSDCMYVLHVASPLPRYNPKHEDELIIPAREGTLRVLKAAVAAGVKRVVLTSSIAAITYGHPKTKTVFDESDWSNTENEINAYPKSKTLAERAAWDFVNDLEGDDSLELVAINPGVVLGPILDEDYGTSGEVVRRLMRRGVPGIPNIGFSVVDVRDVASAHVAAMTTPEAAGHRFCCVTEFVWLAEIAAILQKHFAAQGYKIPTRHLPDFVLRFIGIFSKTVGLIAGNLGRRTDISNNHIREVLDWQPRSLEEMIVDMAESMIKYKVV